MNAQVLDTGEISESDQTSLTNSSVEPVPTDETDVTDFTCVTNDDFLRGVFGKIDLGEQARALVCSKPGDPSIHNGWKPTAWPCETGNDRLNWYACPALYMPNPEGQYKAQKTLAGDIYCLMIDDLGTKVPLERLDTCQPSWLIETSPGNYQAGFIFATPLSDHKQAEVVKDAMIEAGLCDKGANGAAARWMRLPRAINGKAKYGKPSPQCRLITWQPERRFSVEELVEKLGLEMPMSAAEKRAINRKIQIDRNAAEGVYLPRTDENQVIAALKQRGLYKRPLGSGKHDITCPWVHEHTDQVDHGSCYFEPDGDFPIGGYKCQHSHGDKYRIGALLDFVGVTVEAAKHKPSIRVKKGELHRIVDAAEQELASTGCYYQRGGLIVSVNTDPTTGEVAIKPVSQPSLVRALSGAVNWTIYDSRSQDYVASDPPQRHVGVLFDSERYSHLPALAGLTRQPYLRPDGTLMRDAGYDMATGMFGVFDARKFDVPDQPTESDANAALRALRALLSEFAFASAKDEAGALAAILTAAIRPSLPLAPMFHISAAEIASGKSYLSSIISAFSGPTVPPASAFPTNEEECQKLLLATLLESPAAVIFDNLTTDLLPFKSMCSVLTEEYLTGRILGVSKTATVGTRVLMLSSGNNVSPVRDMVRRTVTVVLDPKVETPATRTFKGDPLAQLRGNREHYVSLVLTVVRAWIVSGHPTASCKSLASYGQWSDWVRQPLLWLGLPDPTDRMFELMTADPDREMLGRMLHGWNAVFGNAPTMIREAVNTAESDPFSKAKELKEAILEVAEQHGQINRRRLGKWIGRNQGRIVDGLRFERGSGTTSAERWSVKSVSTVSSVTAPLLPEGVRFDPAEDLL